MALPDLQDLFDRIFSPYGGHYRITSDDLNFGVNSPNTVDLSFNGETALLHMTKHEQVPGGGSDIADPVITKTRFDDFQRANNNSGWGTSSDNNVWLSVGGFNTESIVSGVARITNDSNDSADIVFFGDKVSNTVVEVLVQWEVVTESGNGEGIQIIINSATNTVDGFNPSLDIALRGVSGGGIDGGEGRQEGTTGNWSGAAVGELVWTRALIDGSRLYSNTWLDGSPEPSSWQNILQTSVGPIAPGYVGLTTRTDDVGNVVAIHSILVTEFGGPQIRTDNFTRPNQTGWGIASGGGLWDVSDPDLGAEPSPLPAANIVSNHGTLVTNGWGNGPLVLHGSALPSDDVDFLARFSYRDFTGDTFSLQLFIHTDAVLNINSSAILKLATDGFLSVEIRSEEFGYDSHTGTWSSVWNGGTLNANDKYWVRFRSVGQIYYWKVWFDGDSEPSDWLGQFITIRLSDGLRHAGLSGYANNGFGVEFADIYNVTITSSKAPTTDVLTDTFIRADSSNGWGTSSDGKTSYYGLNYGDSNMVLGIVSNQAVISNPTSGGFHVGQVNTYPFHPESYVRDLKVRFKISDWSAVNSLSIFARTSLNSDIEASVSLSSGNGNQASLGLNAVDKYNNDVFGTMSIGVPANNTYYWIRLYQSGGFIALKTWADGNTEPATWDFTSSNTNPLGVANSVETEPLAGNAGFKTALTNPCTVTFDNFSLITKNTKFLPYADTSSWSVDPVYKGVYSGAQSYAVNDVVYDFADGNFYKALNPHTAGVLAHDDFHRANQAGWGTSTEGGVWTPYTPDVQIAISNNEAVVNFDNTGNLINTTLNWYVLSGSLPTEYADLLVKWSYDIGNTVQSFINWFAALNGENGGGGPSAPEFDVEDIQYYDSEVHTPDGNSTAASLYSSANLDFLSPMTDYYTRIRAHRPFYSVRTWKASDTEPVGWDLEYTIDAGASIFFDPYLAAYSSQAAPNQIIRFKDFKVLDGRGTDPHSDLINWQLFTAPPNWSEFSSYNSSDTRVVYKDVVRSHFPILVTTPVIYELAQINNPPHYTDTVDTHDSTYNLYNQSGHLPTLSDFRTWLLGQMNTFFSAGNVANLTSWTVSSVSDPAAHEIALLLTQGIED